MKYIDYQFDVNKIVAFLDRYKLSAESYRWNFNSEKLFEQGFLSKKEVTKLDNAKTPYQKELILKQYLYKKLNKLKENDFDKFLNLGLWIVEDWGGIKGANKSNTKELIKTFLMEDDKKFNRIASSSKVASFLNPKEFIIYDSRVAYSLNWIILSQGAGNYFFPIPEGRNSKMSAFEVDTLIKIKNVEKYRVNNTRELENIKFISNRVKNHYIPKNQAYFELNKLIKLVNTKLWKNENKSFLYYTEMLLFSIADKEIYDDITRRISLIIN